MLGVFRLGFFGRRQACVVDDLSGAREESSELHLALQLQQLLQLGLQTQRDRSAPFGGRARFAYPVVLVPFCVLWLLGWPGGRVRRSGCVAPHLISAVHQYNVLG